MLSSEIPRSRARARTQTESTKPENVRVVDANPSKSLLRMISQNDVNEISLTDSNLTSAFCIENSAKDVQRTAHRSAANDAQNMLDQAVQYGVQLTERVRQLTETVHNLEHDLDSHRTELKLIHEKYSDQQQQFDNEIRTLRHYEYSFATAQQQLHEMQKDLMNERERYKTLESTYHQMLLKTHGNQGSSVLENTDRDDTNLLFERWMSFTKLKLLEKSQQMMNNKSESVLKNLTLELQREKENSTFIKKMLKEMEEQTKLLQSQINASNTSDKQVEHFQFIQQTNEHLREEVRRMQSVLSTEQERGNRQIKLINDLNDKLNTRGEESTSTAKSSQNSAPENPAKDIELEHIQEKCSRIEKLMVGLEQALRIERARTETQARTIIALRNNLDSRAPTNRVGPTLNRYASNLPTRSNLQNFFNRAEGSSSPRSFASFRVTRPRESVEPAPIILDQIPLIKQDSIVNSDSHSTIETLSP